MNDERTPRGYPLPHPNNLLSDDVHRLREAIASIDADIAAETAARQAAIAAETAARQQLADQVSGVMALVYAAL